MAKKKNPIDERVEKVIETTTDGKIAKVQGLGTFRITERWFRNPKTHKLGSTKVVTFHASESFKKAANKPKVKVYKTKKRK
ncbi:MAG: hypothetical protein IKR41_11665 [Bacteroidales bacterium]|nr:hypothetical protein [Bacteroidales bacterium]